MSVRQLPDRLAFLVGDFEGEARVAPSPWAAGGQGRSVVSTRVRAGGAVLVLEEEVSGPDVSPFSGVDVLMADPVTGEVLLYPFDSVGHPPESPARGDLVDGALVLVRTSPRGEALLRFAPTATGLTWSRSFRPSSGQPWALVAEGEVRRAGAGR